MKESYNRLAQRIEKVQITINGMISHEIHASIVHHILSLENKQIFSLKANSLNLLLEKTPEFHFELSQQRQTEMVQVFQALLSLSIEELEEVWSTYFDGSSKIGEAELSLVISMIALLSKTASRQLPLDVQKKQLKLTLDFMRSVDQNPLTLTV